MGEDRAVKREGGPGVSNQSARFQSRHAYGRKGVQTKAQYTWALSEDSKTWNQKGSTLNTPFIKGISYQNCPDAWLRLETRGGSRRGSWGSGPPPPPFGGPPNFIKKEKMTRACAQKLRVLVLNQLPGPTPFRNPVSAPVKPRFIVSLEAK